MANTSYGSMNVSALKVELRKRGAKLSGLKEQLIQRLVCLLFFMGMRLYSLLHEFLYFQVNVAK